MQDRENFHIKKKGTDMSRWAFIVHTFPILTTAPNKLRGKLFQR